MKILFFADMHLRSYSDRPKWRTDDHYKAQFDELYEIVSIARSSKADLIVSLGDFFDHTRVSHQLVTDVLTWCKVLPCSLYSIVGNHDVNAYVTTDRNNGLGVLFESGAVEELNELVFEDNKVVLRGIHAHINPFEGNYKFGEKYKNYFKLVASHNFVIPHPVPFEAVLPSQIETDATAVVLGHYHKAFSHMEGTTLFINPGSISRWAVNEQHQPQVFLLDTLTGIFNPIALKRALPANEIFDLAAAAEMKSTEMNLQSFVESLEGTTFENIDVENVILTEGVKQSILKGILDIALAKVRQAKVDLK